MTNFAAVEDYSVVVTFKAPQAARTESYTLTCTIAGAVVKTTQVMVERTAGRARGPVPGSGPGPAADAGRRSGADRSRGETVRAGPGARRQAERSGSDRARRRSRCPGSRRRANGAWPGSRTAWSKTARDGYYVVRGKGTPVALRRSGGKFRVMEPFERATCNARASLGRPGVRPDAEALLPRADPGEDHGAARLEGGQAPVGQGERDGLAPSWRGVSTGCVRGRDSPRRSRAVDCEVQRQQDVVDVDAVEEEQPARTRLRPRSRRRRRARGPVRCG